jgi:hypothetical protein
MRTLSTGALVGVALVALSCAAAPVKITEGDQCFRCRRTIADARMAAEILQGQVALKFRTSGCLATYLADHPSETGAIFVTDFTTGTLIAPSRAVFVSVIVDTRTNERDFRAYQSLAEAEAAAVPQKTMPVGWDQVLAKAKS